MGSRMISVTPPIGLPVPSSWYCVGFSGDLATSALISRRLAGHELVLFRGLDGVAAAMDAWCPHLGAHLGVNGTCEQGEVRCPFHGFRFGTDGRCTHTPYGGKIPPTARIRTWPVHELNGLLMVWYGADGQAPTFTIPEIERSLWTGWRTHRYELRGHPQEVAENSVDTGHLAVIHGYRNLKALAPLEIDGARLHARYSFDRPRAFFGKGELAAEIEIHQWGLGYALVEVSTPSYGLRTRQLVLSQPLDGENLHLRLGMAVHQVEDPGRLSPLLRWFPFRKWLAERIADVAIREYVFDVSQDVPIWESKRHTARPALAEGDGPIGQYRGWVRRFYSASSSPS